MALKQNKNDWFGPQLKRLRERARLTQGQLAERMEVSERSVRQWELGKTEPPLHRLPPLARILQVQPWMFFPGVDGHDWPTHLSDRPVLPSGALTRIETELDKVLSEIRDLRRICP